MSRKLSVSLAIVLSVGVGSAWAVPAEVASLVDAVDDPVSVTVAPSSFFDVFVEVFTSVNLGSGQFDVVETSPVPGGFLSLASVAATTGWSTFLDPSPAFLIAPSYSAGPVGAIADDLLGGMPSGNMMVLHMQVDPAAVPGLYTLNVANLVMGDINFQEVGFVAGGDYTVEVTPEPAAALLGLAGPALFGVSRRRRIA